MIERAWLRGVALALPTVAGCALVAGGLEEGRARAVADPVADAGVDGAEPGVSASSRCAGWIGAFRRRAPVVVVNAGAPIDAYQQRVLVDAATLVSAGHLRADGADVRFGARDGTHLYPHWIVRSASVPAIEVWVRVDIPVGVSTHWMYYDDPAATDVSSLAETFVRGVIDDPMFEIGGWTTAADNHGEPPSRTNEWSVTFDDHTARMRVFKQSSPNGTLARVCATMIFPAGPGFLFDVDLDVAIADNGDGMILVDGSGAALGVADGKPGLSSRSAYPISSGRHVICLAAGVGGGPNGGGVDVRFSRPRVRRAGKSEATVDLSREERCE